MALLYIAEFSNWVNSPNSDQPAGKMPPLVTQRVAIGAVSNSAVFSAATRVVRVCSDTACSVLFGPTTSATSAATTTDTRLAANFPEYFGVNPGELVSVILNT